MGMLPALIGFEKDGESYFVRAKLPNAYLPDLLEREILIPYPYEYVAPPAPDSIGSYFLFKGELGSSEISQVFISGKRAGWLLPVSALSDSSGAHSDSEHFLKAASAAVNVLLSGQNDEHGILIDSPVSQPIEFSDLFNTEVCVLMVSNEMLGFEVDIQDYYAILASYGVFPFSDNYSIGSAREFSRLPTKIDLKPVSGSLKNSVFIGGLIRSVLPFQVDPVIRFFYLYQVVESMCQVVLRNEGVLIGRKIDELSGDFVRMRAKLNELVDVVKDERSRLHKVFFEYGGRGDAYNDLLELANDYLLALNDDRESSVHLALYKIRNHVFHGYDKAHGKGEVEFERFVTRFENCLLKLSSTFTPPEAR